MKHPIKKIQTVIGHSFDFHDVNGVFFFLTLRLRYLWLFGKIQTDRETDRHTETFI